jgi:outer membrane protein insertion porin family
MSQERLMTSLPIKLLLICAFSLPLLADQSQNSVESSLLQEHDTLWQESHNFEDSNKEKTFDQELIENHVLDDDIAIVPHHEFKKNEEAAEDESQNVGPIEVDDQPLEEVEDSYTGIAKPRTISKIIIVGNNNVSVDAILNKIPYHINEVYTPLKSKILINNLFDMGYFKDIALKGELVGKDKVNLYVMVQEKKLLKDVIFEGNKHLAEKDIKKKINFSEKPAVDETDLKKYSIALKKLYREKNYHDVDIKATLKEEKESDKVSAIFTIDENKKTIVQRVFFEGNKAFSDKELRSIIFTREDWVLGFMDRAGSYQPEAIDSDRHTLENFYQSNGYLNAKVTNVDVVPDPADPFTLKVTFHIEEGAIYRISTIAIQGNDVVSEQELKRRLPFKEGDLYSKDKIRESIEILRLVLGEFGYIYADVDPAVEPHDDTKTVSVTFFTELGDKISVRKIEIRGNQKTRQKIIRRQLLFDEGDLLTTQKLENSKLRIEQLGFFDQQNGVSWKMKRVNRDIADLELFVREVKTGRVDAQLGFGGSPRDLQNPTESLRIAGSISDTNLLGLGIGVNLSGEFSKQERQLLFNITEPWLFDRPIFAALDLAIKKSIYEDFRFTKEEVKEQLVNGSFSVGFIAQSFNMTKFIFLLGAEGLHYNRPPEVDTSAITDPKEAAEFTLILQKRFPHGSFAWTGAQASQDFRNHPLHPSRGYQWLAQSRIGIPNNGQFHIASKPQASPFNFGFWKLDFDASYYTPLIGERDLVFYFHTHFGIVGSFPGKVIPFRELYHIGGPASVRGFLFGEIGPTFKGVDSIGAKKAFWFNAEIIFPVAPDFSIKGLVFYDGGAGWDTPDSDLISRKRLRNNHFNYRHAVGFGVRLLRPTPVRIDWGFKLDKRKGEKASEVHLSMSHDF